MYKPIVVLLLALIFAGNLPGQYISEVFEYKPAPGQLINTEPWGTPSAANTIVGGVTGNLSLGSFGGYVIFTFDSPVENHPDNPFGVDFTIFGNPSIDWAEHGIVSVMKDENGNGLPDDTWYELAGSDYHFSTTIKSYEVTYTNPGGSGAADVPWEDNQGNSGVVVSNEHHAQPYYPLADSFPDISPVEYTLEGTRVANEVDLSGQIQINSYKKAFGYADNQLRGSAPYTVPDNPYTAEKENSGGDAFDIHWAVDENGSYVNLDEIHFVRVHNAILAQAGWLGEISTEITGAVDVAPNSAITGTEELIVINQLPDTIVGNSYHLEALPLVQGRVNDAETLIWSANLEGVSVDSENMMTFTTSGDLTLTATLTGNPDITISVSTVLVYDDGTSVREAENRNIHIFPNPATDRIQVKGVSSAVIHIYDFSGKLVLSQKQTFMNTPVDLGELDPGLYLLRIEGDTVQKTIRLIKE